MIRSKLRKELFKALRAILFAIIVMSGLVLSIECNKLKTGFNEKIGENLNYITSDFKKLQLLYSRQLKHVAMQVAQGGLDPEVFKEYFKRNADFLIDRSVVNTIIISDTSGKIVFSDLVDDSGAQNLTLANRVYHNQLKNNPNKVIFGDIVTGIITKTPAVPIATGIVDGQGIHIANIVFSVSLDNLEKNITGSDLQGISILNRDQNSSQHASSLSAYQFIQRVLFSSDDYLFIDFYEKNTNKVVRMNYDSRRIKIVFWQNSLIQILILTLLALVGLVLYYIKVLKPLGPSMINIPQTLPTISQNTNIFRSINRVLQHQTKVLAEQDILLELERTKNSTQIYSFTLVANYIRNRLEILQEDVEDSHLEISSSSRNSQISNSTELLSLTKQGQEDIKNILLSHLKTIKQIHLEEQTNCNLKELLVQSRLIKHRLPDSQFHVDLDSLNVNIYMYKTLFELLLDQIEFFDSSKLSLKSISCKSKNTGKSLHFLFKKSTTAFDSICRERITFCRILGIFNNIKTNIEHTKEEVTLSLTLAT